MDYIVFDKKENDEYTTVLGTTGTLPPDPNPGNFTETEIKLAYPLFSGASYPGVAWTGGLAWVKFSDLRGGRIRKGGVRKEDTTGHMKTMPDGSQVSVLWSEEPMMEKTAGA